MATDTNLVIFSGRLGKDADIRALAGEGKGQMARLSVCIGKDRKDSKGTWHTHTTWVNVISFSSPIINSLKNTATRGRKVLVRGALKENRFVDQATGEERVILEVEVGFDGDISVLIEDRKKGEAA